MRSALVSLAALSFASALALGCSCSSGTGARPGRDTGTNQPDAFVELPDAWFDPNADTGVGDIDTGPIEMADGSIFDFDTGEGGIVAELCPASAMVPTGCLVPVVEGARALCNQLDDDCDGMVDEGCSCTPGSVQPCFAGPPGRRGVGACADGMQQCVGSEFGHWGDCAGGIVPRGEACDGLDNDCNGCTDEVAGCVPTGTCPGPMDPRVPDGQPFVDYVLHGTDFYAVSGATWSWTVTGGPCDTILPRPSYTLSGQRTPTLTIHPTLSGDYTVTFTATAPDGTVFTCTFIVHIAGPGLRVEMCYPESTTVDLDLFLSQPGFSGSWYVDMVDAFGPAPQVCSWADCEATIRGTLRSGGSYPRASWGYANSGIAACRGGPLGPQWVALGYCANPRLDIDNNLSEGIGVPENINVDAPRDGERFRVMVQNFSGTLARPVVNIYCGGRRTASYGVAPDTVASFTGTSGYSGVGAMWRVVDVTTHVDASGTTSCDTAPVHPPGATSGYDVTYDNARF